MIYGLAEEVRSEMTSRTFKTENIFAAVAILFMKNLQLEIFTEDLS